MFRRYSLVRQNDQTDCGAAALATIALHYRCPVGLHQLRDLSGTDRTGTNLSGLLYAAKQSGFAAKGVKSSYEALTQVPLPAVAYITNEDGRKHFVVLHRVRENAVIVADPGRGIENMPRDRFCQCWTGYLLLVVPAQRVISNSTVRCPSPMRRFLRLIGHHTSALAEASLCALLITVLGVGVAALIQQLIDSVLVGQEARRLDGLAVGLALVIMLRTLLSAVQQYLVANISRRAYLTLVTGYTRHMLRLPLPFFDVRSVGEILSRVTDAEKVRSAVSETVLMAMVDSALVALMLVVLWSYDSSLALVATAFIPVILTGMMLFHRLIPRRSAETMQRAEQFYAHAIEDVAGVETVKALGLERRRSEESASCLAVWTQSIFSLQKLGITISTMGSVGTNLTSLVVLWYGGYRVMDGVLTIGQLMFFYTLLQYLLGPLERLASIHMRFQDALVAVQRLYEVMDLELDQPHERQDFAPGHLREAIDFEDVSFRYSSRGNVLEHMSLRIPVGKTIAIVGESGSGKSSLLKLLMGFYRPTAGFIRIDGIDMRGMALSLWRDRIGLVSQEPFIFNGTLRDNIAVGRPHSTLAEIIAAARAAGLEEFVANLPDRYDTLIGERGANLSGGQRQRVAIARALVRQPEILIFDEATSHLDTATERIIQERLRSGMTGRTVVIVAHRLSMVRDADLICFLHKGRIVEQGTHEQLVAADGRYAALCHKQGDASTGAFVHRLTACTGEGVHGGMGAVQ